VHAIAKITAWTIIAVPVTVLVAGAAFLYAMIAMPGSSWTGALPPLSADQQALRARLRQHVEALAEGIGPRNPGNPGSLQAAAAYVEAQLHDAGYEVARQSYTPAGFDGSVSNLEVVVPGDGTSSEGAFVVGAHYDTVPGSPGADDNASAVAALIEIARGLRGARLARSVHLVAFVNEEEPYADTPDMGSVVYARAAHARGERIFGMISLESIGYYRSEPGSQHYPKPFNRFYPQTGDFLAFVGNFASRSLVRRAIAAFRAHAAFPSAGLAAPQRLVYDVERSDHASFWREGWPALMVTDTVPFRNPNYHSEDDTPDTLDYPRLARVTAGLAQMVQTLAGGT